MVKLQLPAGRASLSVLGDEGALMAVAPGHLSLDVIGDVKLRVIPCVEVVDLLPQRGERRERERAVRARPLTYT